MMLFSIASQKNVVLRGGAFFILKDLIGQNLDPPTSAE